MGPPDSVEELGEFTNSVEGMALFKGTHEKIPILKRRVFMEDKNQIGQIDDVFGQISNWVSSDTLKPRDSL